MCLSLVSRFQNYQQLRIIIFLVFVFCFLHCSQNHVEEEQETVPKKELEVSFEGRKIIELNIYCWCFSLFPYEFMFEEDSFYIKDYLGRKVKEVYNCTTITGLTKEDIVKKANFRKRIEGGTSLKIFRDNLLTGFSKISHHKFGLDARLIFEIKCDNGMNSYLTYCNNNRMILDDTIMIEYPFRVDSVLLNLGSQFDFICPSD